MREARHVMQRQESDKYTRKNDEMEVKVITVAETLFLQYFGNILKTCPLHMNRTFVIFCLFFAEFT